MKRIVGLSTASLLLIAGCHLPGNRPSPSPNPSTTQEYNGKIVDSDNQQPISGARVSVLAQNFSTTLSTDSDGIFKFVFSGTAAIPADVSVNHPQYDDFRSTFTIDPARPQLSVIAMHHRPLPPPQATLVRAVAAFHTNDDDKDHDSHLIIQVVATDGSLIADASGTFGVFHDQDDNEVNLTVHEAVTRDRVRETTLELTPTGNDTWKFHYTLRLFFSDGTTLEKTFSTLRLSDESRTLREAIS